MAAYLFEMELRVLTEEIVAQIPAHRECVNKLFADGTILFYSVSTGRNFIWCIVESNDEAQAMEVVCMLPLFQYFTDVACHPLLFYNMTPAVLPGISLN